ALGDRDLVRVRGDELSLGRIEVLPGERDERIARLLLRGAHVLLVQLGEHAGEVSLGTVAEPQVHEDEGKVLADDDDRHMTPPQDPPPAARRLGPPGSPPGSPALAGEPGTLASRCARRIRRIAPRRDLVAVRKAVAVAVDADAPAGSGRHAREGERLL